MIKALMVSQSTGDVHVLLGLERANTDRLHNNEPIFVDVQELLKLSGESTEGHQVVGIVLCAGETSEDIVTTVREELGEAWAGNFDEAVEKGRRVMQARGD